MAGGSFDKSQSRSTSRDTIWDQQRPFLLDLFGNAQDLFNQRSADPNQSVAGFTDLQQQGQQRATDFANNGAQNIGAQALQAYGTGINAADVQNNPAFASALNAALRPITQNFQETVLPGLGHNATDAGQYGSSRHGVAQGIASRGYLNAIGDTTADMASQAYGQGLNAMLGTLGQTNNVANAGLLSADILQSIGGGQQTLNQRRLDAPGSLLQLYAGLLGDPQALNTSRSRSDRLAQSFQYGGGGTGG